MLAASVLSVAAGVVVGAVFVLAGLLKVSAGARWTAQARELGVPPGVAGVVAWLELGTGATLAARVVMPLPAIAALLLLVAFTALIVTRLLAGQHPPCACFGSWSAQPLSWWHVGRNVALAALALVALT